MNLVVNKNVQLVDKPVGITAWFTAVLSQAALNLTIRLYSGLNEAAGVPMKTGALRRSLQVRPTPKGISVRWSAFSPMGFDYAQVADTGRHPRTARIRGKAYPLHFIHPNAGEMYRWSVRNVGYPGHEYSKQASNVIKQWYKEELEKAANSIPIQ